MDINTIIKMNINMNIYKKREYNIVALIPARSGSKGIIDKNIKLYKGKPLIAHSIEVALKSKYIKKVYFSSDSALYRIIASEYGATVIERPIEISGDLSPDIETFKHFLNAIGRKKDSGWNIFCNDENENEIDMIVHLRPTYPNRSVEMLDETIEIFMGLYDKYDSLRTVIPLNKTPYKMYYLENGILVPYFKEYNGLVEPFNQARQHFPITYLHNGCIDIVKVDVIKKGLMSGERIFPYIMNEDENNDIDDIKDFITAENKNT